MSTLEFFVSVYLVSLVVSGSLYAFEHFFRRKVIRSADDAMCVLGIVAVPGVNTIMLIIIVVAISVDYLQRKKREALRRKGMYPTKPLQVIHLDAIKRKLQVNASKSK